MSIAYSISSSDLTDQRCEGLDNKGGANDKQQITVRKVSFGQLEKARRQAFSKKYNIWLDLQYEQPGREQLACDVMPVACKAVKAEQAHVQAPAICKQ